jgi:hypothetical protein
MKKYSENQKNPGKFPELDGSMNNPIKVFGVPEKYFRAF